MTITQTCRCGASFTITDDDAGKVTVAVSVWAATHYCAQPQPPGFQAGVTS